jgi:hypothetical protein
MQIKLIWMYVLSLSGMSAVTANHAERNLVIVYLQNIFSPI